MSELSHGERFDRGTERKFAADGLMGRLYAKFVEARTDDARRALTRLSPEVLTAIVPDDKFVPEQTVKFALQQLEGKAQIDGIRALVVHVPSNLLDAESAAPVPERMPTHMYCRAIMDDRDQWYFLNEEGLRPYDDRKDLKVSRGRASKDAGRVIMRHITTDADLLSNDAAEDGGQMGMLNDISRVITEYRFRGLNFAQDPTIII